MNFSNIAFFLLLLCNQLTHKKRFLLQKIILRFKLCLFIYPNYPCLKPTIFLYIRGHLKQQGLGNCSVWDYHNYELGIMVYFTWINTHKN